MTLSEKHSSFTNIIGYVLFITSMTCSNVKSQDIKSVIQQTLVKEDAYKNINFLASDKLKGRKMNSSEIYMAARFIKQKLIQFGVMPVKPYENYFQEISFVLTKYPIQGSLILNESITYSEMDYKIFRGSKTQVNKEIVFVGYGNKLDFDKKEMQGRVAVALCGDGKNNNPQNWENLSKFKISLAKKMGAVGLIELYNSNITPWSHYIANSQNEQIILKSGTDGNQNGSEFLHLWLDNSNQKKLSDFSNNKNKVSVKIKVSISKEFKSPNVLGYVQGYDPTLKNEYLVYCAHYDHIGVGKPNEKGDSINNGAQDNAVGVAAVLDAAKSIAKHPLKRSVLFVFFTGEEYGLFGSEWFIRNSPIDITKIIFCLNSDNIGLSESSKITVIGLNRTTEKQELIKACATVNLLAYEDSDIQQNYYSRSDNINFASVGIPSINFSMGFNSSRDETNAYYHEPTDDITHVNFEYIYKYNYAYIYIGRTIGNKEGRPFWVKGDMYFNTGTSLYENHLKK